MGSGLDVLENPFGQIRARSLHGSIAAGGQAEHSGTLPRLRIRFSGGIAGIQMAAQTRSRAAGGQQK